MFVETNRICCVVACCCASLFLCATDTLPVAEDFESGTLSADVWSGDGSITNLSSTYAPVVGRPLPASTHEKVLWVEGVATRTYNDSESQKRTMDFMVMSESLPDEEFPDADGNEQFRVAFDTNGYICLYHRYEAENRWSQISDVSYPSGTWVRVTLNIEYPGDNTEYAACQVILDGSPCVTEYGFRTSALLTAGGSWYKSAVAGVKLSAVNFSGVGAVDDMVLAATSSYECPGANSTTNGVDYSWLADNGIAAADLDAKASESSAYTAKQSYQAGIDPYSATPLYVTNATFSGNNLTLTFNGYKAAEPTAYTLKSSTSPITGSNAGSEMNGVTFAGDSAGKTTAATVAIPADNAVTYIQVVASGAVVTTNQFGLFKVTSTLTNTIIAAPWVALGADVENPAPMNVAKLVKTTNLTAGDQLILFDGSSYKSWVLNSGCTEWEPMQIVATDSPLGVEITGGAADATLARGQGILLVRQNPVSENGAAIPFYLYGQYTGKAASTTVQKGATALLANPRPGSSVDLNTVVAAPGQGDKVIVTGNSVPKIYTYSNSSWGYEKTMVKEVHGETVQSKERVTNENSIEAGRGFWYKAGTEGGATVTW